MARSRVRVTVLVALVMAPLALLTAACSRPPEQQLLNQFFRAAKARDNGTLSMMSAVSFDPREQGSVDDFTIVEVVPEERTPLDFKTLLDAQAKAVADQEAFTKRKLEYQNANLQQIEEVVKLERDPAAKMNPALQKVKAEWDKWREDTSVHTRAVSGARTAISSASGPAEASLTQPGQPAFDPSKFQGDIVHKHVKIKAQVRSPEGQVAEKDLTVTFTRASGTLNGQQRDGKWIITKIEGA